MTPAAPTSAAMPSPTSANGTARRGGSGASRCALGEHLGDGSGEAGSAGSAEGRARRPAKRTRPPRAPPKARPPQRGRPWWAPLRRASAGSRSGGGGTGVSAGGASTSGSSSGSGTAARRERRPPAANSSPKVLAAWLQVSGSSSALSTAPRSSPRCSSISSASRSIARGPEARHLGRRALVEAAQRLVGDPPPQRQRQQLAIPRRNAIEGFGELFGANHGRLSSVLANLAGAGRLTRRPEFRFHGGRNGGVAESGRLQLP